MSPSLADQLRQRLKDLDQGGLLRTLCLIDSPQGARIQIGGRQILNFSSNDYLGLAGDERLRAAAIRAIERYGGGSGASRLVSGSVRIHHELEESLAAFKQLEACLLFSSGYSAAVGTICAVVGQGDAVILDKLSHASIIDGARLSNAKLRVFRHNDPADLERILQWVKKARQTGAIKNALIVTESVFSMDGDIAPLREIAELKERYDAWLMVDEAHATGVLGDRGSGVIEQTGLGNRIEIHMGTLGKAMGSAGGFICGSRTLIDYLINRARSFVFSTAPSPAASGAALAALEIVQSSEGRELREVIRRRVGRVKASGLGASFNLPAGGSPILPFAIGSEASAVASAQSLLQAGVFAPAIRYPTVPRNQARLRVSLSAAHTETDIDTLINELGRLPT